MTLKIIAIAMAAFVNENTLVSSDDGDIACLLSRKLFSNKSYDKKSRKNIK